MARRPVPGAPPIPTAAQSHASPIVDLSEAATPPPAPVPHAVVAPPAPAAPAPDNSTTATDALEAAVAAAEEKAVAKAVEEAANLDEVHPDHAPLTRRDVLEVQAQARADLLAKQRANAKKALLAEETLRLATEEGLVTGSSTNDQPVKVTLDLAEHSDKIVLNMRPYYHGWTYTLPRHIADTLMEIQYRGWKHQDEIDGKDLVQHYQRQRLTSLSPVSGIVNAPKMADAA